MEHYNGSFGKLNFIICMIAVIFIVLGFVLMSGPGSSIEEGYDPDIFSMRRIVVAPTISFLGFILMIPGILLSGGKNMDNQNREEK